MSSVQEDTAKHPSKTVAVVRILVANRGAPLEGGASVNVVVYAGVCKGASDSD